MKSARTDRHWHNWLIHLFGVLLMVGSAAAVVLLYLALRDLWRAADEFGKGMLSGMGIGLLAWPLVRHLGKGN